MRDIEQKLVKAVKGRGSAAEIKTVANNIRMAKRTLHELRRNL